MSGLRRGMVRGRNPLPTTRARDTSVQATVSGRVSKSYLVNSLLSAHCLLLYCWTIIETRNKCLCEAVTASCWLSSHQCLFPKQSTLSSGVLARPAVGVCQVTQGEKCWSQLMVRAERGNTDTGAECSHCRPAESGLGVITTSSESRAVN